MYWVLFRLSFKNIEKKKFECVENWAWAPRKKIENALLFLTRARLRFST